MVEMLIVIVILGIMAAFARPSMKSFLENIRLRSAANAVKQHLIVAKTRALGDPNIHAGVFFDTAGTPDKIVAFLDSLNNNIYAAGIDPILVPPYKLPITDTLKITSQSPEVVIFRGDGSAKTSMTLTISNRSNKSYTVSVLASTGRIRMTRN